MLNLWQYKRKWHTAMLVECYIYLFTKNLHFLYIVFDVFLN
jgi:hypothetical protein